MPNFEKEVLIVIEELIDSCVKNEALNENNATMVVREFNSGTKRNNLADKKCVRYKCDVCSKYFRKQKNLEKHLPTCNGGKRFQCNSCVKSFVFKSDLKRHSRLHTDDRPSFKCDICERTYSRLEHLKVHIQSAHTGEKPFKCEMCGKDFVVKNHLRIHIESHYGERPHKCETCGASFSYSGDLKKHIRIHTGERPYKCETCGKAFNRKHHLKTHNEWHIKKKQKLVEKDELQPFFAHRPAGGSQSQWKTGFGLYGPHQHRLVNLRCQRAPGSVNQTTRGLMSRGILEMEENTKEVIPGTTGEILIIKFKDDSYEENSSLLTKDDAAMAISAVES